MGALIVVLREFALEIPLRLPIWGELEAKDFPTFSLRNSQSAFSG